MSNQDVGIWFITLVDGTRGVALERNLPSETGVLHCKIVGSFGARRT